jgi:hypothetical protein
MRGKTGVARLALTTGAPVIPIAQWGSLAIHDRRRKPKFKLGRRKLVTVVAGPPVDLSEWEGAEPTREHLTAATDKIMEALRDGVAELLPAHMIPRHFEIVERIPFTIGGKTDRRAVAQMLAERVATGAGCRRAPSTPLESALAAIVADLVGAAAVAADDDFFELGGDSVLATTAVARIRNWLDTPTVMVADVFATRTVAALAARLTEREPDSDRLEHVAELYLEVAGMHEADVLSALETTSTS